MYLVYVNSTLMLLLLSLIEDYVFEIRAASCNPNEVVRCPLRVAKKFVKFYLVN